MLNRWKGYTGDNKEIVMISKRKQAKGGVYGRGLQG